MGRKPILELSEVRQLVIKGWSQQQIADYKGVSKAAVSRFFHDHPELLSPRQTVGMHFPWKVPSALQACAPYKRMRDHAEWVATNGEGMTFTRKRLLRSWHRKLREGNLVLEFDPNIPPDPGVSKPGGFAYRSRVPSDNELLIRVNEYTDLSAEGRELFRLPDPDDEP